MFEIDPNDYDSYYMSPIIEHRVYVDEKPESDGSNPEVEEYYVYAKWNPDRGYLKLIAIIGREDLIHIDNEDIEEEIASYPGFHAPDMKLFVRVGEHQIRENAWSNTAIPPIWIVRVGLR